MLGIPPEEIETRDEDDEIQFRWSDALFQFAFLIMTSCILSLLIGGMARGRPFAWDASSWEWLAGVLVLSAIFVLLPMIVMFVLSILATLVFGQVNARRSYRDGLAAAWFFVLATNITTWQTFQSFDPLLDRPRHGSTLR